MENKETKTEVENNEVAPSTENKETVTKEVVALVAPSAKDITERLMIKKITEIHPADKGKQYVIHTSPSKINPPKAGEKESRFTMPEAVFNNAAKSSGKPGIIFKEMLAGGTFVRVTRAVNVGDAWIKGNGTYTTAHNARVSEQLEASSVAVAELKGALYVAYAASVFGDTPAVTTAKSSVNIGEGEAQGANIEG